MIDMININLLIYFLMIKKFVLVKVCDIFYIVVKEMFLISKVMMIIIF